MSNLSVVRLNGVDYNLEDENVRAMIAPTEASSTASAAHAPGTENEYFILDNTLYRAITNIAVGDTITAGTNCAAVPAGISNKLGNEVADLKSALGELAEIAESKNIYKSTLVRGNVSSAGVVNTTPDGTSTRTGYIEVDGGETYIASYIDSTVSDIYVYVSQFSADKTFIMRTNVSSYKTVTNPFTLESNCAFIILHWTYTVESELSNIQIEKGTTVTPYMPFEYIVKADKVAGYEDCLDRVAGLETSVDEALRTDNTNFTEDNNIGLSVTLTGSKYIKADGSIDDVENSHYKVSQYIDVSGISALYVSVNGDYSHGLCAFYKSDYSVISVPLKAASGSTVTSYTDELVSVPSDAKYMVIAGINQVFEPSGYYQDGYKLKMIPKEGVEDYAECLARVASLEETALTKNNTDFTTPKNIFFDIELTSSKYIAADGTVSDIDNSHYKVSQYIDVSGINAVWVSVNGDFSHGLCAFYKSDYSVSSVPLKAASGRSNTAYTNELVAVPSDAKYMVIAGINQVFEPSGYYQDGYKLKKWTGLKWAAVGDSITENNIRATMHYHDYIAQETGITVVNMGRSGTGYKRQYEDNLAFYQRIASVPVDSDVVTIFGSGNDQLYYADAMGTATDVFDADHPADNTLGACINHTIDVLYSVIPAVQLGIIAPCPWGGYNPADNTNGMARYTELLRQICQNRSIPFLDMYHESNLRPWDVAFRKIAYSHDEGSGTHPDETGHKLMAGRFRVFVDRLLGITDKQT